MWFSSDKVENSSRTLSELLISAWSVKANSRFQNGTLQNFHTTLLCNQNVYDALKPLHNITQPLLDNIQLYNKTKVLEDNFAGKISPKQAGKLDKCFLGKLSPYYKTLFLDMDVFVTDYGFVQTMMDFVSGDNGYDVVQPQVWALRQAPYTNTLPVGCTCTIAFRDSPPTRHVMDRWLNLSFDFDSRKGAPGHLMMRDQEIFWWAIRTRPADFKYFQLPLEYQCPLSQNVEDRWTYKPAHESTAWGNKSIKEIPCKVIHSHETIRAAHRHYCRLKKEPRMVAGVDICAMISLLGMDFIGV